MLKPRKCRKLLLIISPQLKAAKGKKLFAINGKWAGDEFVKYVNASPSIRPQLSMVGRKLGNIYRRHMEKIFAGDRKVDWTKLHGVPDTETELPQRQTGQKALTEILSGKTGFARSVPTLLGGGGQQRIKKFTEVEVSDMIKTFGDVAEQQLIERFKSGVRPTEEQYEEMQRIGRLMLQRASEKANR